MIHLDRWSPDNHEKTRANAVSAEDSAPSKRGARIVYLTQLPNRECVTLGSRSIVVLAGVGIFFLWITAVRVTSPGGELSRASDNAPKGTGFAGHDPSKPGPSYNRSEEVSLDPKLKEVFAIQDDWWRGVSLENLVSSGSFLRLDVPNLYELLDELIVTYHGTPSEMIELREVRVELAKRGERGPLETITNSALLGEAYAESRAAIDDLAKVGSKEAVSVLVDLLSDERPGVSSQDVYKSSPSDVAAIHLGRMYPNSPLGMGQDAEAKRAFKEWWIRH